MVLAVVRQRTESIALGRIMTRGGGNDEDLRLCREMACQWIVGEILNIMGDGVHRVEVEGRGRGLRTTPAHAPQRSERHSRIFHSILRYIYINRIHPIPQANISPPPHAQTQFRPPHRNAVARSITYPPHPPLNKAKAAIPNSSPNVVRPDIR